ncbi:DUF3108 domain-containing protein [Litoreibacter arenae]|uniref:DUF3108 domain-containing protein n=1 Tax=Litoreibacter arenae DSM 19593 TaxID=1123360 RepID=S9S3Y2_9RHOB|nr:DUF3108 domain-containing protein [Litoreibacter arenae]EPX80884.1 hypothetical protein thalar_01106 [Litoreibacter arenae DSM 19593]
MKQFLKVLGLCALPLTFAAPAVADGTTDAVFSVAIRGITAGTLKIKGQEAGGRYSASGVLQSGGLVGLVARVKYTASSSGRVSGSNFSPARYDEKADTGKRKSSASMTYKGGVPSVSDYVPGPNVVKPSTQNGTVDPMTALYAAFRDVRRDQVCKLDVKMYDGKRRSQVKLSSPRSDGDMIMCDGEYRRLAGFSPEDMAEKARFPFNLFYAQTADGRYRVEKVVTQSLYGNATMTRK